MTDLTSETIGLDDPISNVLWKHFSELDANWWNPNRMPKKEFTLLEKSILTTGWVQPVMVTPDMVIIDGFHRWRMSQDSRRVHDRYGGYMPVTVLNVDEKTAMVMTVRMNRAKGVHVAVSMSSLVKKLIEEHGCSFDWVAKQIGASEAEVYLLAGRNIFEAKKVADWEYSEAWYPSGDG